MAASYLGIWLFFVGLTHGLSKIAFEAGSILPSAFTKVEGIESSPIWSPSTGKFVVMIFSFSLGFCATLAGAVSLTAVLCIALCLLQISVMTYILPRRRCLSPGRVLFLRLYQNPP